ncbi:MAG: ferritin-like domain-containing protein [Polyangiaceae bacterium]
MTSRPHAHAIAPFLLALAPSTLVACASPIGEFDAQVCLYEDGLADLEPPDAKYVALRSESDFSTDITVVADFGVPCSTSTNYDGCTAEFDALLIDPPLVTRSGFEGVTKYDVVYTAGNEVGRITTRDQLIALLGTIDTAGEALLVAFVDGHDIACGENNVRVEPDGTYVLLGTRGSGCGEGDDIVRYEVNVAPDGTLTVGESEVIETGDPGCAIGRRPHALVACRPRVRARASSRSVGEFFASAARLEAASVPAFRQLAVELGMHRAPATLVRHAIRSAEDEVRHARVVSALARRYGVRPTRAEVGPMQPRPLVDVALDNATEGCVRETFGAVVATVQARRARDPQVRRVLAGIARDEARHAALSWAIDAWASSVLSPREARLVREARRESQERLGRELEARHARPVEVLAGMPDPDLGNALFKRLASGLFDARA